MQVLKLSIHYYKLIETNQQDKNNWGFNHGLKQFYSRFYAVGIVLVHSDKCNTEVYTN